MENVLDLQPHGIEMHAGIIRGTTWRASLQWIDSDSVAVDLSTSTAKLTVRDSAGNVLLTLTNGNGITLGASGFIDVEITDEQSGALPLQKLSYNLDVMDSGEITPIARGTFRMIANTNLTDPE